MSPKPTPAEDTEETGETQETQETGETQDAGENQLAEDPAETEETQETQETEDIEETSEAFDELADELEVDGLNPEGITEDDLESGEAGVQTADLSPDDTSSDDTGDDDGDDWFDDVEEADIDTDTETDSTGDSADSGGVSSNEELEDVAIEVFAALAVSGLPEDEQERLQPELERLYEAMQLGPAFAEFADQYVLPDGDEDADPATKLAASAGMCALVTLQKRPDGTDLATDGIESATNLIST